MLNVIEKEIFNELTAAQMKRVIKFSDPYKQLVELALIVERIDGIDANATYQLENVIEAIKTIY